MKHILLKWLAGDKFEVVPKKKPILKHIKSKKELIEECIENFDFDRVEMVMKDLKWTWFPARNSPTLEELKESAEEQLYSACAMMSDDELNVEEDGTPIIGPYIVSTGGFRAEAYFDNTFTYVDYVRLVFELTEWEAEQD